MTLAIVALALWGTLALVTTTSILPIWIPIVLGIAAFLIVFLLKENARTLTALLGATLFLGGVSTLIQTEVNKPEWLVQVVDSSAIAQVEMEVVSRPKEIYRGFDLEPVYGVSVFLRVLNGEPVFGRGFLLFEGTELARGMTIGLEAKFDKAGKNARDAFLAKPTSEIQIISQAQATQGILNELRSSYVSNLAGVTPDSRTLVAGLAIGEVGGLSDKLHDQMQTVSLTHLVAVSGSNCAIVVGMVYLIAVGFRFGRTGRALLSLSALLLYILLIGPDPSVLRAGVMAASVIVMISLGRRTWALNALSIAAITLLISDPWLAVEFGFGLSVLATAGILLLAPAMFQKLSNHMPKALALALSVTIAAQLFCLPLLVQLQSGLPTYSVVANLLAGPMVAPVTVIGMIALVLTPISPFLVSGLTWIASLGTWVIEVVAIFFAELPVASFPWATGLPATVLSVLLILAVAAWLGSGPVPLKQIGVAAFVVVAVATMAVPAASGILPKTWPLRNWSVVACDVGQGDAIVIRSEGRTAVIDVGSDQELVNSCLTELEVNHIDLLVLTHFDFDHVGGLEGALESRRVGSAIVSGFPDDRPATRRSKELISAQAEKLIVAEPSIRGVLGEFTWNVLAPTREAKEAKDSNDASIVMLFKSPSFDLLLLGDLGEPGQLRVLSSIQKSLASSTKPLVLKVSHHGSNDQSVQLHETLKPDLAVISVGEENGYGHPGKELMNLLARTGASVLRTDKHGAIAISADNTTLSWSGSG